MKPLDTDKTYLITGGAGFIGFSLSRELLKKGARVIGLDNMNDYYEVSLKEDRLAILKEYESYTFEKGDIADKEAVHRILQTRMLIFSPIWWVFLKFWKRADILGWSIWYLLPPAQYMVGTRRFPFLQRIRWISQ